MSFPLLSDFEFLRVNVTSTNISRLRSRCYKVFRPAVCKWEIVEFRCIHDLRNLVFNSPEIRLCFTAGLRSEKGKQRAPSVFRFDHRAHAFIPFAMAVEFSMFQVHLGNAIGNPGE